MYFFENMFQLKKSTLSTVYVRCLYCRGRWLCKSQCSVNATLWTTVCKWYWENTLLSEQERKKWCNLLKILNSLQLWRSTLSIEYVRCGYCRDFCLDETFWWQRPLCTGHSVEASFCKCFFVNDTMSRTLIKDLRTL